MPRARPVVLALLLLASGLAALAPPASAASVATVTRLDISDPTGTPGIVGHSAVHFNGATYLFGGRHVDNSYSDKIYKFDHATNRTTVVATLPAVLPSTNGGRYSGAAMTLGGKIYYMGGAVLVEVDINGDGEADPVPQSSADVFEFDPATNAVRVYEEKLPKSAWGMSGIAVSGTRGYLFGGFTFSVDPSRGVDASRRDWVVEFDITRNGATEKRFQEMATILPYPVQDAASARIGEYVWVIGGLANNDNSTNPCGTYVNDQGQESRYPLCQSKGIVPFDVNARVVRPDLMKEMPYRTQFISAAVVNGKAYVPGGILPDGTAAPSIVEFDPLAPTPVRVLAPTLPRGTFGAGVVTDGGSIFVLGGRTGSERQLTDEVVRIDVQPTVPWAPRAAAATALAGGLRLSWETPGYDGDRPVSLYRVYRSTDSETERLLKETPTLAVDDLSVRPGVTYLYRITALNAVGESTLSARVTVTAGVTPPGPVGDFQAYPGDQEALLRWTAPAELGGANLTGYRVVRDGQVVATLTAADTSYRDAGLTNGVAYAYSVRAYNVKGDGPSSTVLRISPAAVPPTPTSVRASAQGEGVLVSWQPPTGAWDGFVVYRSVLAGARGEPVASNLTATQHADLAVEKGRTYHYSVASLNAAGESPPSEAAVVSLVRTPGAPTALRAIGVEGEVRLTWQPPADTGDAPAEDLRYYVTRSASGSSPRIVASDLKVAGYNDKAVAPGVAYTYTVTTLNPIAGPASEAATATPKAVENKPPEALATVLPTVAKPGEPVQIDASQSYDPDGRIRTYVFDFGDGTDPFQSETSSATHTYARNGTYEIKVIVTDERNEDASTTARVVVGEIVGDGTTPTEDGFGDTGSTPTRAGPNAAERPGSKTPGVPAPGLLAALGAVVLAALVAGRMRRRG